MTPSSGNILSSLVFLKKIENFFAFFVSQKKKKWKKIQIKTREKEKLKLGKEKKGNQLEMKQGNKIMKKM